MRRFPLVVPLIAVLLAGCGGASAKTINPAQRGADEVREALAKQKRHEQAEAARERAKTQPPATSTPVNPGSTQPPGAPSEINHLEARLAEVTVHQPFPIGTNRFLQAACKFRGYSATSPGERARGEQPKDFECLYEYEAPRIPVGYEGHSFVQGYEVVVSGNVYTGRENRINRHPMSCPAHEECEFTGEL
jgi:hypothetical protein